MDFRRVLLINPTYKRPEEMDARRKSIPINLPLGLGYLAAYLSSKGVGFELFDERLEPLYDRTLQKLIAECNAGLVGISCATAFIYRGIDIARSVKKISRDIKVVLGGPHPTIMPDECLKHDEVDYVVRQEGEITLWELVKSLAGQMDLKDVLGLSYKKDGEIIRNPDRPLIHDLDTLPDFPFNIFRNRKDRYSFKVLSSRGCPQSCVFCSARSVSGRKYRYRSAEKVVQDLETLVGEFGRKRIGFADDTFTANKMRVLRLCELIRERNLHKQASFFCTARGDTLDHEILGAMKAAGFRGISLGVESGSNRIMKVVKKGERVEDNVQAAKIAKEMGFKLRGSFIIGLPTETRQESLQTIRLALDLPLDYAMFNLPIPYPGTELYEIAKREGNQYIDFSNFDALEGLIKRQAIYVPAGRSEKELLKLQRRAYFRFYSRPRQVLNFLKKGLPELDLDEFSPLERLQVGCRILLTLLKGGRRSAPAQDRSE